MVAVWWRTIVVSEASATTSRPIRRHRGLFCAALDELGIPWTRPRWFEVAVYRKAAVARFDEFIGRRREEACTNYGGVPF
jgi:hypothetical protein